MPVKKSNRGHRECQQAVPEGVESFCEEARGWVHMIEIQPVRVELGKGARRDNYAGWVLGLEDVEG
jgi:hypothetical protein